MRQHAEKGDVKAPGVHLPRVRACAAQEKAAAREVQELRRDTRCELLSAGLPARMGRDVREGIILREDAFVELAGPSFGSYSFTKAGGRCRLCEN